MDERRLIRLDDHAAELMLWHLLDAESAPYLVVSGDGERDALSFQEEMQEEDARAAARSLRAAGREVAVWKRLG
jgi:hypothetical protein